MEQHHYMFASQEGHKDIVELLLNMKNIDV